MTTLADIYSAYENNDIRLLHWRTEPTTIELSGRYGVFMDFFGFKTIADLKWMLGHELGHCVTGATHKVNSPFDLIQKHEYAAEKHCAFNLCPPEDIVAAIKQGLTEPWQIAERLDVPEWFVVKSWGFYLDNGLMNNSLNH